MYITLHINNIDSNLVQYTTYTIPYIQHIVLDQNLYYIYYTIHVVYCTRLESILYILIPYMQYIVLDQNLYYIYYTIHIVYCTSISHLISTIYMFHSRGISHFISVRYEQRLIQLNLGFQRLIQLNLGFQRLIQLDLGFSFFIIETNLVEPGLFIHAGYCACTVLITTCYYVYYSSS